VSHWLALFLFVLNEGGVTFAGNETAKIVEADHVILLLLLIALSIIDRKHFDSLQTILLTDIDHKHLLVKIFELRSGHEGLLVVADNINDGIFLVAHFQFKHGTVRTKILSEVILNGVEPKQVLKAHLV